MNELFPVFVKLENLETLIVGGGNVGLEKLEALIHNSPHAKITIVAPEIRQEIIELKNLYPQIHIIKSKYEPQYLESKDLVICATDDKQLHHDIYQQAKSKKILINVADTPELCDFYLGSIVKKGDLKIAISTNGKSPTFAKRLKETLNEVIPDEVPELLTNLKKVRDKLSGDFNTKVKALNKLTRELSSANKAMDL